MRDGAGGVRRAAIVVGREVELDRLLRAVHDTAAGAAGCVFLVGEGGVGKTRLLTEVAAEARRLDLAVLAGRAPVTTPVAFSVIAEALRSWLRGHECELEPGPFDAGLRLVLPEWPVAHATAADLSETQLRLLALEGVVRLVREIATEARGAVVLLDDLHGADPDSLEAARYLATAAPAGVLVIGALRSRESTLPETVARALERDRGAGVLELEPLGRREVGALLGALLDAEPPEALVADVLARTDGVPLLVEEVLDAHLRSGAVDVNERGAHWRGGDAVVSRTVRDMVEARLDRLTRAQREIVTTAAVLGDFDAALLAAVAGQPVDAIGDAVTAGVDHGLLETVGGVLAFRHAVIREAVLDALVPPVASAMHRRAADALAATTDAARLEQRAFHLDAAGDRAAAAALLVTAASARLADHALLGAEATARRAYELAMSDAARVAASDVLAQVLAVQGRWTDALAIDETASRDHGETADRRHRMALCALEAARPELAAAVIERAIADGDDAPIVHVIAGRLAMAAGDAAAASAAAALALAGATAANDVAARCAALDVEGRALDYQGRRDEARAVWTQQAAEASAAGLTEARLRAVVQLSKLEVFAGAPPQRLYEAVELARDAGALVEQAWAEENLAIALAIQGDPIAAEAILVDAVARCRDLGLDQLPYLLCALGGARSLRDHAAAVECLDEAEALAPTADLAIHTYGLRADIALRAGDYDAGVSWNERAVDLMRAMPGGMPSHSRFSLAWALAAAGRLDDAGRALDEARSAPDDVARWHGRPVQLAALEAVLRGDEAGVDAALASATGRMPFDLALMRVLAAEIMRGPARVRWLREALDAYDALLCETEAARVRRLLRDAGGPVPRRRRASAGVPDALAAHGVTAREAEVLRLVGEGCSNAVIAERLFLSVRTVETHVSSLLSKLHVDSRGQLTALYAGTTSDPTVAPTA